MSEVRNYSVKSEGRKVTIYTAGAFGIVKTEAKLHEHGMREYAQYESVPYVRYTEKGKRKVTGFVKTYKAYLVIVDGWDNPNPDDPFEVVEGKVGDLECKRTRFGSFDSGIVTEFDEKIEGWMKQNKEKVVFDKRWTKEV